MALFYLALPILRSFRWSNATTRTGFIRFPLASRPSRTVSCGPGADTVINSNVAPPLLRHSATRLLLLPSPFTATHSHTATFIRPIRCLIDIAVASRRRTRARILRFAPSGCGRGLGNNAGQGTRCGLIDAKAPKLISVRRWHHLQRLALEREHLQPAPTGLAHVETIVTNGDSTRLGKLARSIQYVRPRNPSHTYSSSGSSPSNSTAGSGPLLPMQRTRVPST